MKGSFFLLVKKVCLRKLKHSYLAWSILTINQLQYKFKALQYGTGINEAGEKVYFNLRRNIHRLEKGLSYSITKPSFAGDYIEETVGYLEKSIKIGLDRETVDWANSVLSEYFSKVIVQGQIQNAKSQFERLGKLTEEKNHRPYLNMERPALNVSYDQLLQLSIRRRSVRYFSEEAVSEDLVKRAYDVAKYAPSACNRQAFQYLFFNEKNIVNRLAATPGGVNGYELPAVVVLIGRYDGYFDVRDINAPIIDASLSAMGFLYACETLGLGTVCINWPNLIDRELKIRDIINLEPAEFVIMMIGVGHPSPDGKIPYSAKRSSDEVVLINDRIKL